MKHEPPKFKVIYCKKPMPDNLRAEKYIKFLKYLAKLVKESEATNGKEV